MRGLGPALDQIEFAVVPAPAERVARLREGAVQVAGGLSADQLARVRDDPLLTVVPIRGGGLGIERSVRGIPAGAPAPPLSGVWRTRIDAG